MWLWLWSIGASPAAEPCYGWTEPNHLEGDHLSVEWNDLIDADQAADFLDVAETSWDAYTAWGFPAPIGAPSVAFINDPLSRGGFTDTTTCAKQEHARMFVYEEAVQLGGASATTAHELFHAVQYAYQPDRGYLGNYVMWPWWAEGTATWATLRSGFPADAWVGSIDAYLAMGHLALHQDALAQTDPDRVRHLYGTALLALHLEETAGIEAIDATFDAAVGEAGSPVWFPDVLPRIEVPWTAFWHSFLAGLPTLDFPVDADRLQRPRPASRPSSLPASFDARAVKTELPQGLGWVIHRFDADLGAPEMLLSLEFEGDPGPLWHALLVTTGSPRVGSEVRDVVALDVGSDGKGTAAVPFDGDHPVFLVLSPEVESTDGWGYAWSADLQPSGADEPTGGCGCNGSHAPWWLGLVVLLGLRRRGAPTYTTARIWWG